MERDLDIPTDRHLDNKAQNRTRQAHNRPVGLYSRSYDMLMSDKIHTPIRLRCAMTGARVDLESTIEKARAAGLLRRHPVDGLLRIARPEGHQITAVLVLDPATGHWVQDEGTVTGNGFYSLCRFLGINLTEAAEVFAPTPTPKEPDPEPDPQLQLTD